MSLLFSSGGQNIGASESLLPVNIQGRFPLGLSVMISLLSKGLPRVFTNTTVWKHQSFSFKCSLWSRSHTHIWLLEKTKQNKTKQKNNNNKKHIALPMQTFDSKTMSLLTNMLSRFAMASFPRIKHLLILLLQSPSTVILELKKIKQGTASTFSLLFATKWWA